MLKRTQAVTNTSFNLGQKLKVESPYKNLEDSPVMKKQNATEINIKEYGKTQRKQTSSVQNDFNRRLQEIKKKYISPARTHRIPANQNITSQVVLPPRKSAIINENILELRKQYTPNKTPRNELVENKLSLNSVSQSREPLRILASSAQQQSKQSTPTFEYSKRIGDEERIHSINRINERIRSALADNNFKNDKFKQDNKSWTEVQQLENKIHIPLTSKRHSIEIDNRPILSNLNQERQTQTRNSYENKYCIQQSQIGIENKSLGSEFDRRMNEIQQRIKKSQENRQKLMENYKPLKSEANEKIESHTVSASSNIKFEVTKVKQEIPRRQRSMTGVYSYRYGDNQKELPNNAYSQYSKPKPSQPITQKGSSSVISKTQIKKLVNEFVQQIKLDEQFRNGKIWLESSKDPQKWTKLKDICSKRQNKHYSQSQVKNIFKCNQDDQNPFYSEIQNESIDNIVNKYYATQNHWKTKILHQFDIKRLKEQSFKEDLFDLESKGFLQIQDIVRYVNIETGKFYRNRDLVIIYKRITRTSRLSFDQLIKVIEKL